MVCRIRSQQGAKSTLVLLYIIDFKTTVKNVFVLEVNKICIEAGCT